MSRYTPVSFSQYTEYTVYRYFRSFFFPRLFQIDFSPSIKINWIQIMLADGREKKTTEKQIRYSWKKC